MNLLRGREASLWPHHIPLTKAAVELCPAGPELCPAGPELCLQTWCTRKIPENLVSHAVTLLRSLLQMPENTPPEKQVPKDKDEKGRM